MNERIKKLWIEKLRSGLYKQRTCVLRVNNSYCCLGVLCEALTLDPEFGVSRRFSAGDAYEYGYANDWRAGTLPEQLHGDIGISGTEVFNLMRMNDALGNTFSEIADYIESHL